MLFLTGATGLLGGAVLSRMLRADRALRVAVLVRDPARWRGIDRVTPVAGDLCAPGLGLAAEVRAALARDVDLVLHAASRAKTSQVLCSRSPTASAPAPAQRWKVRPARPSWRASAAIAPAT